MTGDEYIKEVSELQSKYALTDGEVASALVGVVIALTLRRDVHPLTFMQWAIDNATMEGAPPELRKRTTVRNIQRGLLCIVIAVLAGLTAYGAFHPGWWRCP
jgi:hypothetical protein